MKSVKAEQSQESPQAQGQPPAGEAYNKAFEVLVEKADHPMVGFIAYGLYKYSKREWVMAHIEQYGLAPSPNEYDNYAQSQTGTTMEGYRAQARQAVQEFVGVVVDDARPKIREEALRGSFWRGVWQSLVAAIIFALGLAIILFIAAYNGASLPITFSIPAGPSQEVAAR